MSVRTGIEQVWAHTSNQNLPPLKQKVFSVQGQEGKPRSPGVASFPWYCDLRILHKFAKVRSSLHSR